MIGLGHQHIVVWRRMCVACVGMVDLVVFEDGYVENVVQPCGSVLAWRDGLVGVGNPM